MDASVVVGVDGSESSLAAVELAAREAVLRDLPLRLVHAFIWPYMNVSLEASPYGPPEGGLRHQAERIVEEAVARAGTARPAVQARGEIVTGGPAAVLIEASHSACLVVVGDRGLGGFTGLLVGSVAVQLAAHARCPVLVVRGRSDPAGDVVLGVAGSLEGAPAVEAAFEEAFLRGVPLTAVHTWQGPAVREPGDMLPLVYDVQAIEQEEARLLAEALAGHRDRYPDVPVRERLLRERTRPALIGLSRNAELLVVGTRGRGGIAGLLLGSVSQAVLHHADCPVLVVPTAAAG